MTWLDHKQLQIIKGIGKTPTDNNSAEIDPVVVNLLNGGITLIQDGWSPAIPSTKNGGVWADSPTTDGRLLLAAPVGNVIEKMTVLISDNSYLGVMKSYSSLNQMANSCRDFWESQAQIDPVYLMWYAGCGVGQQFALLYDIELAPEYLDSPSPTIRVTITLEREPYWRGLAPGANPKLWSLYVNGTQISTSNVDLTNNSNHLVYVSPVYNKHEWSPTDYLTPITKNYVDISANLIPGDAPALVEMNLVVDTGVVTRTARNIYVWRSTKPTTIKDRNGAFYGQSAILNVGDANVNGTSVIKNIDATNGVLSNGSSTNKYIGSGTAAGSTTYIGAIGWTVMPTFPIATSNLLRGNFALFLRCKQTTGAAGDVQVRFNISKNYSGTVVSYTSPYTNMPTFVSAYPFGLLYLGNLSLPLNSRAIVSGDGRGLQVDPKTGADSDINITIDIKNNNGANRNVQFLDLVLMSQDELCTALNNPAYSSGTGSDGYAIDNTGYFTHGTNDTIGRTNPAATGLSDTVYPELIGQPLTLIPHINNRLYFLFTDGDSATNPTEVESWPTNVSIPMSVRINIVPRWSGIRDT